MNRKKEEFAGTIDMLDDDGNTVVVSVYQTMIEFRPIDGSVSWGKGTKRMVSDRGHVNPTNDPNVFTEFDTGRRLRKVP